MNKKEVNNQSGSKDMSHIKELWKKSNEKPPLKEQLKQSLIALVFGCSLLFIAEYFYTKNQQEKITEAIKGSASFGGDYKFSEDFHFEVVNTSDKYGTTVDKVYKARKYRRHLIIFKYSIPRVLKKDEAFKKAFNENLDQVKKQFNQEKLSFVNLDEVYRLQLEMDEIFKAALVGKEKEMVSVTPKVRPNYESILK